MRQLPEWGAPLPSPDHAADADVLLRGAVLIARHRYPLLQHDDVAEQLDDLAVQASRARPALEARHLGPAHAHFCFDCPVGA